MILFATILSGLALLAASVCLVLVCREKKRSKKRNVALVRYVDKIRFSTERDANIYADKCTKEVIQHIEKLRDECGAANEEMTQDVKHLREKVENLEKGIVPDFEQAKAAADAVNDFNKGISNILGFDPVSALQAERQKERYGEAE